MQCINGFFERFKRLNDYKPSEDEVEAGLQRLQNLSSFGVPLSLARRSNMTVEQILMRPADEAYTMLLYDFEQDEYRKRYQQVHEDNRAMQESLRRR